MCARGRADEPVSGIGGESALRFCATLQRRARSGFSHRNAGKRAKSPSVEHSVRPCSMARAARCASGTRFALPAVWSKSPAKVSRWRRSEEHTSELQSRLHLVCRLLLEKKKKPKRR